MEFFAVAICGDSTLTIQGGAATTEDQIKYTWNYALLVAEGPTTRSLVLVPMLRGMAEGKMVRFEEITRCLFEVQDCLLSLLSYRIVGAMFERFTRSLVAASVGNCGAKAITARGQRSA